ncbi:GH92 family glycosyl hydrolase [Streptococcus merionis]|uniref:GH92 family glycosyl hydrolase n=1 Tax=Streptococcus merionis TaxID=400065 RepID=UPI0026F07780|nr:GH92 family glycosyl hydrolase [Streptococcus merionis]
MPLSNVQTIDTRYGTYNSHAFSNGNCLPLTGYPFGMNYFAPQSTDQNGSWWFNPYEPIYQGIRLTHQPSPWLGDFSQLLITPVTGALSNNSLYHRQSSYDMENSLFRPDLLKIISHRYQLTTHLVPSLYGAALQVTSHRKEKISLVFHAPEGATYQKISDDTLEIQLDNATETQAENFCMSIHIQFDQSILQVSQLKENNSLPISDSICGDDLHLRLDFAKENLEARMATSFISAKQAHINLSRQGNFSEIAEKAHNEWNRLLQRIKIVDTKPSKEKDLFYHCLYRCLLFPQTFYEVDEMGKEWHFDTHSQSVKPGKFFTNNGYWDTFRTTMPLLSLLYPEYVEDFLEGILQHYRNTGFLPKWLSPDERGIMPGTLVDGVIADAASKKIAPHLLPELLKAMLATSQTEDPTGRYGRHGSEDYRTLGYLPYNYRESVSHSLDYAYSDWAIGQVAGMLGQTDLAATYQKYSLSYAKLFDPATRLMRAKEQRGKNRSEAFNPYSWGRDYAECSAIQASLSVFHDIDGLVELMGGREHFTDYLTKLCNEKPIFKTEHYGYEIHEMSEMVHQPFGQLAISNQPSFHIPYLFHWSNKPEYASFLLKQLRLEAFDTGFHAFPGDEDNGSLSAWYIFSCLGFYPVCPGKPVYQLGIPQFDAIKLRLPKDKTVTISCKNNREHYYFVHSATLDGKNIAELTHADFIQASHLEFSLGLLPK